MKKLLFVFLAILALPARAEFDQTHASFDKILQANVKGEAVDYAALKESSASLDAYLKSLADVYNKRGPTKTTHHSHPSARPRAEQDPTHPRTLRRRRGET
jgi:hypothetical protein